MALLSHSFRKTAGRGPKNLLESRQNSPTPAVKPVFREKVKKSFVYGFLAGGALSALLTPLFVQASFFSSFIQKTTLQSSASSFPLNSQTMTLLMPAINLDPHPPVGGGDIAFSGGALIAQEGPSGTVADIDDRPGADAISVYTVREGDTLAGIAKLFGVTVNTIVWANDIKGGVIHPGDELIILPITGLKYTVAKGDTLASLAKKYKGDAHEIAQYNDLADNATLAVGTIIIIPGGEMASAPAPKRASSFKPEPYLGGGGAAQEGYYTWPVAGGVVTQKLHGWNGVDIGAPRGTSIYAAAAGTVIIARSNGGWNGGYGNYLVIKHPNGTQTLYAHASRILVSAGQQVSAGQTIAQVGSTGQSTGPHLHFEIRGAKNPFAN